MKLKIFAAPGDHRDDFGMLEQQLNDWLTAQEPTIVNLHMDVTAMTDTKNVGRYLMTVLVTYEPTS